MATVDISSRRASIPIVYTRGSHYDVGVDVGRTFQAMIKSRLTSDFYNNVLLRIYKSQEGRQFYNENVKVAKDKFPQYVEEIQGTADGAGVQFHELFLLHLSSTLPLMADAAGPDPETASEVAEGCTAVHCNYDGKVILGHTEDAMGDILNHVYLVSAHIKSEVSEERFTSLCYAGNLPGSTMSYNHHGLISTINILLPSKIPRGKISRRFLSRAILAAKDITEVKDILLTPGCDLHDGLSINLTFFGQQREPVSYNVEVGPAVEALLASPPPASASMKSQLNVLEIGQGQHYVHCNRYLRLPIKDYDTSIVNSSNQRHKTADDLPPPRHINDVIRILGDQSHPIYNIFSDENKLHSKKTVAAGVFDCQQWTWSIYTMNPRENEPVVVIPLQLK